MTKTKTETKTQRGTLALYPSRHFWGEAPPDCFCPCKVLHLAVTESSNFHVKVQRLFISCAILFLHHVDISLFQVDVQDRHHLVSLRRPAMRPQVWLLDLLWLAGFAFGSLDLVQIDSIFWGFIFTALVVFKKPIVFVSIWKHSALGSCLVPHWFHLVPALSPLWLPYISYIICEHWGALGPLFHIVSICFHHCHHWLYPDNHLIC